MPIELPSPPSLVDERLALLEDPVLAERLFLEHAELYGDEPPRTERQVLAWATRRFGTVVLAVTATLSIAAGYVLAPSILPHNARTAAKPAAAVVAAPSRPVAHRDAKPHAAAPAHAARPPHIAAPAHVAAPGHATHVAAAPVHRHSTAPAATSTGGAQAVAPVLRHPIVSSVPVSHPRAVAPVHNREAAALRAKLHAQEVELAALRHKAAAQAAALRVAAQARPAPRTQPEPQAQTRTETATSTATATAAQTPVDTMSGAQADTPTQQSNAGVKQPPPNPGGGWNEHPPMSGTYGIPSGGIVFGPADPCTPRGGRTGVVIQSVLTQAVLGAISHRH